MASASTTGFSHDVAEHSSQLSTTSTSTSASTPTSGLTLATGSATAPSSGPQPLGLGRLAEEVPFSHHANSTIVCRITGKIMDEDNMPMAFPNGNVYSLEVCFVSCTTRVFGWTLIGAFEQAMQEMAAKNNNVVTCPRTGVTCTFSELRKVFIS